ncbi:uncharacterized protein LOC110025693 isoform X2 [Phalaenopsis equestris]|uniref:uncharacterized protein LOC110025693 isoform X2 n=1 Tax=Phalaenopsis equestris TaxID=78828 RepID=UPI0009E42FC4|nr:uncharacterized protein LOC110025693 isoform X2 [Phalaenopsis equestris]
MERKVLVVCGTVGFLGLLSAALGFAAEATRVKASDVLTRVPGEFAGCICCKRNTNPANTNWTVALISFVLSWVTFIIAFLLLLTGSALNDQRGQQRMYFGDYCYVVKPGVFSGGAVLALGSVSLGIVYFVSLQTSKDSQPLDPPHNQGIALGQPQIPPQPVFVHEDTFNRQQIP